MAAGKVGAMVGPGGGNGGGRGGWPRGRAGARPRSWFRPGGGPGPDTRPSTAWISSWVRSATGTRSAAAATTRAWTRRRAATATRWSLRASTRTQVPAGFTKQHGPDLDRGPAYGLAPDETQALIERGWKGPKTQDGFKNHGQRTRTMVELAKRLGYSPRVGAMQANFGTPYENGIADLQDQLAEARAAGNQAEVERLEAELDTAIAAAKPGKGPDDSWATADLDVNDDGTVDARDLDALDHQEATPANEPAS